MKIENQKHDFRNENQLLTFGSGILRYGLAIVLIWIGILKFTTYEAEGIKPLVEHSPVLSWGYQLMSVSAFSMVIGFIEILSGILISLVSFSPKISVFGSYGAIVTFLITLTFLISTPGIIQPAYQFPFISPQPGQFLLKDIVLLGAALWTAADSKIRSRTFL
ncbi:DUF417 family protein [Mucilaginibacter terrigena]|uniref:DUF417 family protein n=1 Tax=Mucilaginibacter terrigena TaxID=2492395 RepID=A0A4V1ZBP0_9SPHI|nr:DUF417 family protein [Mucilaginibacter terrigena]RYU89597.1 DUF417 family protein [Mucilaginibacter terrigena]